MWILTQNVEAAAPSVYWDDVASNISVLVLPERDELQWNEPVAPMCAQRCERPNATWHDSWAECSMQPYL